MAFVAIPATVFTLVTLLLAGLWRIGLALFRRPAPPRYGWRVFIAHAWVFALHLLVTVPLLLAFLLSKVGTRGDEAAYAGPRLAADGTWLVQTRDTLAQEKQGKAPVDPALVEAAARSVVQLTARDGVKLRAFLVPPVTTSRGEAPLFTAVLVHGLYRGALEIETPGRMLREVGGEVLLLELRNHGGSGRARATFGLDESLDVLAAAEFLGGRPEARGRPLVLYAVSLGTAAAALAAPQIQELAGLVFDAPLDDLRATARRELRTGPPMRSIVEPWASTILWSAQHLMGVPIGAVKPREALRELPPDARVLFIGAGRDDRMPPDAVQALFDGLPTAADRKELWIEPTATHGKVWVAAPEEYRRRLQRFCAAVGGTDRR